MRVVIANWRGERRERTIEPLSIHEGQNEWHPERQWLLLAQEVKNGVMVHRYFAMSGIHSWRAA